MRACVQRVSQAEVQIAGEICARIDRGLLVLVGVAGDDTDADADQMADKLTGLRIFEDEQGKMNLALGEAGGAMLVVSQFTLLGDCRKGRRPNFTAAAGPEEAERLYQRLVAAVRSRGVEVGTGRFRANMQVCLVNDGPVTVLIDTKRQF